MTKRLPIFPVSSFARSFSTKNSGPGEWYIIHLSALKAPDERKYFSFIRFILSTLPCEICRTHSEEYLKNNNLENYKTNFVKEEERYFYWSWKFHNSVNERLGKRKVDYENALAYYQSVLNDKVKPEMFRSRNVSNRISDKTPIVNRASISKANENVCLSCNDEPKMSVRVSTRRTTVRGTK